jgi:hypothetical protein
MPKKLMKKGEQNRKKRDADLRKINRLEVVHLVRDEGVAGSNPATPTIFFSFNGKSDRRSRQSHWSRVLVAVRRPMRLYLATDGVSVPLYRRGC